MHFNLPNSLTWFRIALIPLIILVYNLPFEWARPASAWMFGAAAITDALDGYLARRLSQTSAFGAFLDPVADKVIVCVALLLIVQTDQRVLVLAIAAIIVGREIARDIEDQLDYPGQIRVTVIRESRAVDIAK